MENNRRAMNEEEANRRNTRETHAQAAAPYNDEEAARKMAENPRAATFNNADDTSQATTSSDTGKMAANPALSHKDIVPADATPAEKKVASDITGAEESGEIGSAAAEAGFTGGTHGAGTSSESRVGNPENYGNNQLGPGLATGPMSNTPPEDNG